MHYFFPCYLFLLHLSLHYIFFVKVGALLWPPSASSSTWPLTRWPSSFLWWSATTSGPTWATSSSSTSISFSSPYLHLASEWPSLTKVRFNFHLITFYKTFDINFNVCECRFNVTKALVSLKHILFLKRGTAQFIFICVG